MSLCYLAQASQTTRIVARSRRRVDNVGVVRKVPHRKVGLRNTDSSFQLFRKFYATHRGGNDFLLSLNSERVILCSFVRSSSTIAALAATSRNSDAASVRLHPSAAAALASASDASRNHTDNRQEQQRYIEIFLSGVFALAATAALVVGIPTSSITQAQEAAFVAPPQQCVSGTTTHTSTTTTNMIQKAAKELATATSNIYAVTATVPHDEAKNTSPTTVVASGRRNASYDVSVRAIRGGRVTMEDEYFVANGGRFAAVFDGHGGGGVSQMLKRHLYNLMTTELQKHHQNLDNNHDRGSQQHNAPSPEARKASLSSAGTVGAYAIPSVTSHVAALRSAFDQIDKKVLENDALKYQGSTAVAVILHECHYNGQENGRESNNNGTHSSTTQSKIKRTLLSANVGDSRAILSRRGRAVDLTRDHKPNDEKEKARILSMGETIEWDRYCKVHRVRNLSLSRAIGDRYAKPVVSGEPEIKHFPLLEDGGDEFFLLASDGLWDVMTSQEAVSYVHDRIAEELERYKQLSEDGDTESYKLVLRKSMSKFLAREALRRGSGDNVCVIMVWLDGSSASSS